MQELIANAKANPQTSKWGLGLLLISACNLVGVVGCALITKTAPDATALGQDCSIIVGFAVAGILGLVAKDPDKGPVGKVVRLIASHFPEAAQAKLVESFTKIAEEAVEAGVKSLETPKK